MPEMWQVDEVAAALRVSRRTVYRLLSAGQLERVKVGSRTLIPASSLTRYLTVNNPVARAGERGTSCES